MSRFTAAAPLPLGLSPVVPRWLLGLLTVPLMLWALGSLSGCASTGASAASVARDNLGAASSGIIISAGSGLTGGGDLTTNRTLSIATNSNGFGTRTVSTASPSGGNNGDIWYQI